MPGFEYNALNDEKQTFVGIYERFYLAYKDLHKYSHISNLFTLQCICSDLFVMAKHRS